MADITMTTGKTVESQEIPVEKQINPGLFYYAALAVFAINLCFIHLPLGGDRSWAVASSFLLVYIILALYLVRSFCRGYFRFTFSPVYILFIALIFYSLIQINLSSGNISFLKNNYDVWKSISEYLSQDLFCSISLTPSLSLSYLLLFCLSALVFYLSMELFRREQFFYLLPVILVFSIALNSFFGFFNQAGIISERIFCYIPPRGMSVAGTFVNRNHFAVFIEMGLFTSLGLFAGAYFSRSVRYRKALMTFSFILFSFFTVSILFSYSRAGLSIAIFLLVIFSLFLILELKKRKKIMRSVYLFILFAVGLSLAAIRGLSYVWDRFETTFYSDDPSLMGRFDFWNTTLDIIKEYWLMGTGFGSFTYVSPRFESGLIPNKIANHAHNDWLELFAETGVPFATLIIVLILFIFITTFLKVFRQKETFRKWLGLGAGFSILSVMLHEIVGFALRKPGIMVLFGVLAVIFIRCAGEPPERKIRFYGFKGVAFLSLGLILLCFLFIKTVPFVSSGYALEYLVDRHRSYYALHTNRSDCDDAIYKIKLADEVLKNQPSPVAYMVKGQSQYMIAYETLRRSDFRINKENRELIQRYLLDAEENMKIALQSYPTRALYYVRLANCLEYLLELERNQNMKNDLNLLENKIERTFDFAYYYSPNIGNITGDVAMGKWKRIVRDLQRGNAFALKDENVQEVIGLFKKYAVQSPADSYKIYSAIWSSIYSPKLLRSVTPDYISAQINLYKFFFEKGLYSEAEKQLDVIHGLNSEIKECNKTQYDLLRKTRISEEELNQFVYAEKASLAASENDWEDYRKERDLYLKNLHIQVDSELDKLDELYKKYHYSIVDAKLQHILKRDSEYPRTLFLAVLTSIQLGKVEDLKEHITSILISKYHISTDIYKVLLDQLNSFKIFSEKEKPLFDFYRSALKYKILSSSPSNGYDTQAVSKLNLEFSEIIKIQHEQKSEWLNFHLVYLFQAKNLKLLRDYNGALNAYLEALKHTPHALFIINEVRTTLAYMEKENLNIDPEVRNELRPYIEWAENLRPDTVTDIDFGNKIRLHGISISKNSVKEMDTITICYYFECLNIIDRDFFIKSVFFNNGKPVFQEHFQAGFNQNGRAMLTWKIGEIVQVKKEMRPVNNTLKQNNSTPPLGNYLLNLSFYTLGADTQLLNPVVKTNIPVFRIEL